MTTDDDARMCAAIWTWLHPERPVLDVAWPCYHDWDSGRPSAYNEKPPVYAYGADGEPYDWPVCDGSPLRPYDPIPDYLHSDAAAMGLLRELAARWVHITLLTTREKAWGVDGVVAGGQAYQTFPRDPDLRRAIVLAAYEASKEGQ